MALTSYVDLARLGRATASADLGDGLSADAILNHATARIATIGHSALWLRSDYRGRRTFLIAYAEVVETQRAYLEQAATAMGQTDA